MQLSNNITAGAFSHRHYRIYYASTAAIHYLNIADPVCNANVIYRYAYRGKQLQRRPLIALNIHTRGEIE